MFSALKKLTRSGDERCPAPMPMSSSLQKKFSKGVHFNMKILIKGDRNVGKSCLLQRLQGGPFIEDYVPTDQIQVAPIHWTYKNTDYIVKVEVWEVVDKGKTKKKPPIGLKLENQSAAVAEEALETPVLDATFLDVYKNATGVILMMDITKLWTFEYVVKELSQVPADLPVVVLGNHCDMQHHRQVHPHHIDQALYNARINRTAPVRYAESSMRNGFGLRLLHKFLSVPFLRLQRTSLLEQLQRNQKDMEEIEKELDDFQSSEESQYNIFVDRLVNKRKQSAGQAEPRPSNERAPSIVLGGGKPIVPPNVNPLLAQSLNPTPPKVESPQVKQSQFVSPQLMNQKLTVSMEMTPPRLPNQERAQDRPSHERAPSNVLGVVNPIVLPNLSPLLAQSLNPTPPKVESPQVKQSQFVSPQLMNQKLTVSMEMTPPRLPNQESITSTPSGNNMSASSGALDEFYAGNLDTSFLEDLTPVANVNQELEYDTDSDDDTTNPKVIVDQDELDIDFDTSTPAATLQVLKPTEHIVRQTDSLDRLLSKTTISNNNMDTNRNIPIFESRSMDLSLHNDFPLWAGDSSARRSPEGGEDPDPAPKEPEKEKKKSKKKSKDKDRGDYGDKSERKEKKHKNKKLKSERKSSNPQQDLLIPSTAAEFGAAEFNYEEYDSI